MGWVPPAEHLQQCVAVLQACLTPDTAVQQQAYKELAKQQKEPLFPLFLAHIFAASPQLSLSIRCAAGVVLANHIRLVHPANIKTDNIPQYLRESCINAFRGSDKAIKNKACYVIAELASKIGWPDLFQQLLNALDESPHDQDTVESSLKGIQIIFKFAIINDDESLGNPRDLISRLMNLTAVDDRRISLSAIDCVNESFRVCVDPTTLQIDTFFSHVFRLVTDEEPDAKIRLCESLSQILDHHLQTMLPFMDRAVLFILACAEENQDEEVQRSACKFLCTFASKFYAEEYRTTFVRYINHVLPVVLRHMPYSEEEIADLEQEDEEGDPGLTLPGIRRRHMPASGIHGDMDEEDSGDEPEGDVGAFLASTRGGSENRALSQWTTRKYAAACLDGMAKSYREQILNPLLPELEKAFHSDNWRVREAAILALGAIADGVQTAIQKHLGGLIPFLVQNLSSSEPLIRVITCWTLRRYSYWIIKDQIFRPVLEGLLENMRHSTSLVQLASCSSVQGFAEDAREELMPFFEFLPFVTVLCECLDAYKKRNRPVLFRCIAILSEVIGTEFSTEVVYEALIPRLTERLLMLPNHVTLEDCEVYALLETFSYIAGSLGEGSIEFAGVGFDKAIQVCHGTLAAFKKYEQRQLLQEPNRDILLPALDFMASICESIGSKVVPIVEAAGPRLFATLVFLMDDEDPAFRQSAFWLLVNLSYWAFPLVRPHLGDILPICGKHLVDTFDSRIDPVTRNVVWALSDMANLYQGNELKAFLREVTPRVIQMFNKRVEGGETLNIHSTQSACSWYLGTIAKYHTELIASAVGSFISPLCTYLRRHAEGGVTDARVTELIFEAVSRIARMNPVGLAEALPDFLWTLAGYPNLTGAFVEDLRWLIEGYIQQLGGDQAFERYLENNLDPVRSGKVKERIRSLLVTDR